MSYKPSLCDILEFISLTWMMLQSKFLVSGLDLYSARGGSQVQCCVRIDVFWWGFGYVLHLLDDMRMVDEMEFQIKIR